VSGVVVDSSVWIDFLAGRPAGRLEEALEQGSVILPPIVVAELVSGAERARDRRALTGLLEDLSLHETPLAHWVQVGDLRRLLGSKGIAVSTPDAHVAQCALDRDAILLTGDAIFKQIARHTKLRVHPGDGA